MPLVRQGGRFLLLSKFPVIVCVYEVTVHVRRLSYSMRGNSKVQRIKDSQVNDRAELNQGSASSPNALPDLPDLHPEAQKGSCEQLLLTVFRIM